MRNSVRQFAYQRYRELQPIFRVGSGECRWVPRPKHQMRLLEYAQAHDIQVVETAAPEEVACELPTTVDGTPHWKFTDLVESGITYQSRHAAQLHDVVVCSPQSHLLTSDGVLVRDVSSRLGYQEHAANPARFGWTSDVAIRRLEGVTTLATAIDSPTGYFHWLLDALPRWISSMALINDPAVLINVLRPASVPSAALESLKIPTVNTILPVGMGLNQAIRCDTLVAATASKSGVPHPQELKDLRNAYLPTSNDSTSRSGYNLYIRRRESRRILNEDELLPTLIGHYGFLVVDLEEMSFADQILTFARASTIIGPHGAGLANLAFASPHSKVLEIFSPNYVNTCFWIITQILGQRYGYVVGEGPRPPKGTDPGLGRQDITVDVTSVFRTLDLLLSS